MSNYGLYYIVLYIFIIVTCTNRSNDVINMFTILIVPSPFGLISHSKMYVVKKTYMLNETAKINIITQYCKSQQTPGSTQCWGSAGTAPKTWTNTEPTQSGYPPSKHGTPAQRRANAGPPSTMLAQHRSKHRADVPRPLDCVRLNQIYQ